MLKCIKKQPDRCTALAGTRAPRITSRPESNPTVDRVELSQESRAQLLRSDRRYAEQRGEPGPHSPGYRLRHRPVTCRCDHCHRKSMAADRSPRSVAADSHN